jgi:subtilase family serine protease
VSLANTGKAPAKAVTVRFTDNGALVGTSAPVTLAPGATTTVSVPWNTKKLKGTQQIVAVADPTNAIRESDESDNKTGATVRIK